MQQGQLNEQQRHQVQQGQLNEQQQHQVQHRQQAVIQDNFWETYTPDAQNISIKEDSFEKCLDLPLDDLNKQIKKYGMINQKIGLKKNQ